MIPFGSGLYFYILGILAFGAIVLGYYEKKIRYYGLVSTMVLTLIVFASLEQLVNLTVYIIFVFVTSFIYLKMDKFKVNFVNSFFIILSLVPLALTKSFFYEKIYFLGISYITFRHISILQGIRFKRIKEIGVTDFLYYLLFFPTISSGPIDRFESFQKEINHKLTREEYIILLREGIWKFMNGLLYSFCFANIINIYWLSKVESSISYMYAYTFYLFFNFAGYSRMAVGTGYIYGVRVTENFKLPFLSVDIKDFWSRWHISLSNFFRDYVYSKLAMAIMKKDIIKNRFVVSYICNIVTMTVMGIWHGTELHFVLYGLYHGVLAVINEVLDNKVPSFKKFKKSKYGSIVCTLITFNLVAFGFLLFSGRII